MMQKMTGRRLLAAALAILMLCPMSACGDYEQAEQEEINTITAEEADPQKAIEEVYVVLPEARTEELSAGLFEEYFPELVEKTEMFVGKISDPTAGLADMIIIRPATDEENAPTIRQTVHEALLNYQETRVREFENYDILDSLTIATEAQVFTQGDYEVLLMLPDNDAAREIIDRYLPL